MNAILLVTWPLLHCALVISLATGSSPAVGYNEHCGPPAPALAEAAGGATMTVPEAASSAVSAGSVWLPLLGVVVGGLLTGTVTLIATAKQQKAQLRREFMLMRQKWIENIRELIPEIIETAGWFYVSKMRPSPDW